MRELIFTGKHRGWTFGEADGNVYLSKYSYELRMYPSYKHTLYYPRMHQCDIGWAPMTVKVPTYLQ
jgi:hypothetical protein